MVGPRHFAFTFHVVVFELAFVEAARVGEVVLAESVELPVHEVAFIVAAFEFEAALSSLFTFYEFTGKLDLIIIP